MNTELGKLDDISVAYGWPFDRSEHTRSMLYVHLIQILVPYWQDRPVLICQHHQCHFYSYVIPGMSTYIQTLNMIYVTIGIPCLTWSKIIHHVLNISCVPWILCPLSLYIVFFIKGLKLKQYLNNIGQK